jgi:membrane peptidoglycan carboxypeptidase
VRTELLDLLNVPRLYDLDRLDVEVASTIDVPLQSAVRRLLTDLRDPAFIASHALTGKHLLSQGNPADVAYTVLLYEATPHANLLRVHTDSLDQPFDLNTGMKMGLGSTAKLRTLAHYLEIVAQLHAELTAGDARSSRWQRDPITAWARQIMESDPRSASRPSCSRRSSGSIRRRRAGWSFRSAATAGATAARPPGASTDPETWYIPGLSLCARR